MSFETGWCDDCGCPIGVGSCHGCIAYSCACAELDGPNEDDYCPHCGKEFEDFSDLGCGRCDQRSSEWGMEP